MSITTVKTDTEVDYITSSKQNIKKLSHTKFQLKKKIEIIISSYGSLYESPDHILDSLRALVTINAALQAQTVQNE